LALVFRSPAGIGFAATTERSRKSAVLALARMELFRIRGTPRFDEILSRGDTVTMLRMLFVVGAVVGSSLFAQQSSPDMSSKLPDWLDTPQVHADHSATFRLLAPNAHEVKLNLEGTGELALRKDDAGVWTVTTGPLAPDYYTYSFTVDGAPTLDPFQHELAPSLLTPSNVLHVPAPGELWEVGDVPHGVIHHHFYRSATLGDERDYYVYTPPGYSAAREKYPALYLLHGFSDDASAWSSMGRANVILDNLIALGKAKPMIVIMPLGYGSAEMLGKREYAYDDPGARARNITRFSQELLTEIVPRVEKEYRIEAGSQARAIAGLSMGGAETLWIGLNHPGKFGWMGAFSPAIVSGEFETSYPSADEKVNRQIRLLWIACGTGDSLIADNRKLREWLKSRGVRHVDRETPGDHAWTVWRRNLAEFAALLFR
jgi:enterochelin esterase family protein